MTPRWKIGAYWGNEVRGISGDRLVFRVADAARNGKRVLVFNRWPAAAATTLGDDCGGLCGGRSSIRFVFYFCRRRGEVYESCWFRHLFPSRFHPVRGRRTRGNTEKEFILKKNNKWRFLYLSRSLCFTNVAQRFSSFVRFGPFCFRRKSRDRISVAKYLLVATNKRRVFFLVRFFFRFAIAFV